MAQATKANLIQIAAHQLKRRIAMMRNKKPSVMPEGWHEPVTNATRKDTYLRNFKIAG